MVAHAAQAERGFHRHVAQRRQQRAYVIVETDDPLVHHHHHACAGQHFGERRDVAGCMHRHRLLVARAVSFIVDHHSVAHHAGGERFVGVRRPLRAQCIQLLHGIRLHARFPQRALAHHRRGGAFLWRGGKKRIGETLVRAIQLALQSHPVPAVGTHPFFRMPVIREAARLVIGQSGIEDGVAIAKGRGCPGIAGKAPAQLPRALIQQGRIEAELLRQADIHPLIHLVELHTIRYAINSTEAPVRTAAFRDDINDRSVASWLPRMGDRVVVPVIECCCNGVGADQVFRLLRIEEVAGREKRSTEDAGSEDRSKEEKLLRLQRINVFRQCHGADLLAVHHERKFAIRFAGRGGYLAGAKELPGPA
ncbi:MAG: hypothetical protein BWY09_02513 [Candidatus Hydrogenedentes bacterium ADurb.Bin179]|nr:MAG: hypothetical protein BWY09_02513 [Candidatus Hydrogenedentes bacterium ADurb.Bin179]